jgi:hypothetical protein
MDFVPPFLVLSCHPFQLILDCGLVHRTVARYNLRYLLSGICYCRD